MIAKHTLLPVLSATVISLAVGGCKVGPNYRRPAVATPDQYRGNAPALQNQAAANSTGASFAEMSWQTVFKDEALKSLIQEALANNYDLRIAATRVLQANDQVGIVRANQLPSLNGAFGVNYQRNALVPGGPTVDTATLSLNYIVDFWGQYRRATEAARANLLASQYAQSVVQTTLVASVANVYYQLRQYDDQLTIAQKTVEADKEIVRINKVKFQGGESAITDVYQADLLMEQAQAGVIASQQAVEQTENQLSILLGRNPGPIARGLHLVDQPHLAEVPTGLPSALLQRRPDIRQSEAQLIAANANVGVAKAAFFPQIPLTGVFGASSTSLTSFLQGPATIWAVGGQAIQPIYNGAAIRSAYKLAWAQRDQAELAYKQTVQNAFGDVAHSLVGYNQSRLYRMKIEEQTKTYQDAANLANVRFNGGYASFLEVLVTEQQYFLSEIALTQAWNAELTNYVALYQALGGGWQP
jgi:multidrug efflux system outer membrane protein